MKQERLLVTVPLEKLHEIYDVHSVLVTFNNPEYLVNPYDIGFCCYNIRWSERQKNKTISKHVDIESLNNPRRKFLFELIQACHVRGYRHSTFYNKIKQFHEIVILSEELGVTNCFDNKETLRLFYFILNQHFRNTILNTKNHDGLKKANYIICNFKNLIKTVFGKKILYEVISNIQTIPKATRDRVKPAHDSVIIYSINQYKGFAFSVHEQLISNENYPFKINLSDGMYYLFPIQKISNALKKSDEHNKQLISEKHNDSRSYFKLLHANIAFYCFMKLFIILTGVTASELRYLEYDDEIKKAGKDNLSRKFRAIKYRARGRITLYSIESELGIEIYKKMLSLREWILDGQDYKYLFFEFKIKNRQAVPNQLHDLTRKDNNILRDFIFPSDFQFITPTVARKSKSKILHALKITTSDISKNMNHTIEVNKSAYQISDENEACDEIEKYWNSMIHAARKVKIETVNNRDVSISSGHCEKINTPLSISELTPFKPDCIKQYGCLYCQNFVVHADGEDLHKLESLAYVINKLLNVINFENDIVNGLLDLYARIQVITKSVGDKSKDLNRLHEEIKKTVHTNGILTPFWELRLQRYEEMGVII